MCYNSLGSRKRPDSSFQEPKRRLFVISWVFRGSPNRAFFWILTSFYANRTGPVPSIIVPGFDRHRPYPLTRKSDRDIRSKLRHTFWRVTVPPPPTSLGWRDGPGAPPLSLPIKNYKQKVLPIFKRKFSMRSFYKWYFQ